MNTLLLKPTKNEGRPAIALAQLKKHIRNLITLEATDAPLVSCYVNLEPGTPESGATDYQHVLSERVALLRKSMTGVRRTLMNEAWGLIDAYLAGELKSDSKGAAIFARGGARQFFLPLQFQVPLPNWVAVDAIPNVYRLVELGGVGCLLRYQSQDCIGQT